MSTGAARDGDNEWRLIDHTVEGGTTTYTIDFGVGRVFVGEHEIAAKRLIQSANAIRQRAQLAEKRAQFAEDAIEKATAAIKRLTEERAED